MTMRVCTPDCAVKDGKVNALMLSVARMAGIDCSNGGITSKADHIYMVCSAGIHEIDVDDPKLFKLEVKQVGSYRSLHLAHYKEPDGSKYAGGMFGGNYANSSDARFRETVAFALGSDADAWLVGAIPVFDRLETWREYEVLSR